MVSNAGFSKLVMNVVICFPWSDRLASFIFKKISTTYPSPNSRSICQSLFQVKMRICGKDCWFTSPLRQLPGSFSLRRFLNCASVGRGSAFCTTYFVTENIKKMSIQGSRFTIINPIFCFKAFIWETKLSSSLSQSALSGENTVITVIVWCHCLDWGWSASSFTFQCFCTFRANVNTMTKADNILVLLYSSFVIADSLIGSGDTVPIPRTPSLMGLGPHFEKCSVQYVFYKWRNRALEKWGNLFQITWLVRGRMKTLTEACQTQS